MGCLGGGLQPVAALLLARRAGGRRAWRCCCRPTTRAGRAARRAARPARRADAGGRLRRGPRRATGRARTRRRAARWPERDRFELALAHAALERDMPVLGICRGMQMLNVACGGTLEQHLARRRRRGPPPHAGQCSRPRRAPVGREPGGAGGRRRARPRSSPTTTRASRSSARGSCAVGWADGDDSVEAIELPGKPYALGVLWHPEEDERSRVIGSLVDAARGYGARVGGAAAERSSGSALSSFPRYATETRHAPRGGPPLVAAVSARPRLPPRTPRTARACRRPRGATARRAPSRSGASSIASVTPSRARPDDDQAVAQPVDRLVVVAARHVHRTRRARARPATRAPGRSRARCPRRCR